MTEDPKPAASLTAERIKRGAAPAVEEGEQPVVMAPRPEVEAALRRQVRETVSAKTDGDGLDDPAAGFFNWRRAGLFGILYLGALAIFWSALDP